MYIPPESDFIPRFFLGRPHEELSDARIARILDVIFGRYRFVKEWQGDPPDPARFAARMPARTPASFLATLYSDYAEQYGAARWGDKTPIYTSYVDLIADMFPTARFVHIIRDGRDVALSMLDKWGDKEPHVDIFFTARNYVRRIRAARTAGQRLDPDRYYEMRYEALVQDPERELGAVCEFLGEEYFPEMAQPHVLARETIEPGSWHDPIRRPPNTGSIERWREKMTPADLRLFQFVAGSQLEELGYGLAQAGRMPAREVARLSALAAKYALLQSGRRVLQAAGLFPPI